MNTGKELPNLEYLHEILDYNTETGIFVWRERADVPNSWNAKFAGKVAGTYSAKGIVILIKYKQYKAHRLAWLYVHGIVPADRIVDHVNCDCYDNRLINLRLATHGQNASNSRLRLGKKLPKGVSYQTKYDAYRARIGVDGRVIHLGTFATPEEAHAAYVEAACKYKNEFARAA